MVEGPVERPVGAGVGSVGRVLEEEDDAVEGLEGCQLGGVEGQELLELDVLDAEVLDEGGEDALGEEYQYRGRGGEVARGGWEAYCIGFDCAGRGDLVSSRVAWCGWRRGDILVFHPPLMIAVIRWASEFL